VTTLLLVRHGETDWNAERRWQGHADIPLNGRGRDQAVRLAEELAHEPVAAIYSSDLSRARETAEIVGIRLGVPIVLDADLREIDVGTREGLTWPETRERTDWDGEPHEAHAERILGALRRIAARHDDERLLVVTHGGSIRRVHEHLGLGDSGPLANCAVWVCVYEESVFRALA
jgi:2,3-bisphosphoglycerate-dependent phosphoglycerate mutase